MPATMTSRRPLLAELGARLRSLRLARDMSQEEMADMLQCDQSAVSRIERGDYPLTPRFEKRIERLLAFGADDGHATGFLPYLEIEQSAASLRSWEGPVIPGLLQTPEYARFVLAAANPGIPAGDLDRLVEARMARQLIWDRAEPAPPMFAVVVGEGALRTMFGSPQVMREQAEHVANMAAHPRVRLQVLPFSAGDAGGGLSSFVLASFAPEPRPDAAYLEDALTGRAIVKRAVVAKLALVYDSLVTWALRPDDSIRMIREVAGQWT